MLPPVLPLFDQESLREAGNPWVNDYVGRVQGSRVGDAVECFDLAVCFLLEQEDNENSFKSFRSELTCFLHWCWDVALQPVHAIDRKALRSYLEYCQKPPADLIARCNVAQFLTDRDSGERLPNPNWRPFLGKRRVGEAATYSLGQRALQTKLALLSTFFNFLIHEEYTERNPAMMLMKSTRFRRHSQHLIAGEDDEDLRAFTDLQWSYVMEAARKRARANPVENERSLFLISLLYGCYLRISEVAARPGYAPTMGQFRRDVKTGVWGFHVPTSKGGKKRTVAVSKQLLNALKRYRNWLGLPPLPSPRESEPLFVRHRAGTHGRDSGLINANLGIRQIRDCVMDVFDEAALLAEKDGLDHDAQEIRVLTVHSIRHTGISHDINLNGRPLSHVQADAGHDSIDTTSRYLHTSRTERHESAREKPLDHLGDI